MNKKKSLLIKQIIREINKDSVFIEKEFDEALIGYGMSHGERPSAVYNTDKCIEILIDKFDMDEMEAYTHFSTNIHSPKKIKNAPIFVSDFRNIKEFNFDFEISDIDDNINISSIFNKIDPNWKKEKKE